MENLESMLCIRKLSCLVDADYSVSAWEDDKTYFDSTKTPELDEFATFVNFYCRPSRKGAD